MKKKLIEIKPKFKAVLEQQRAKIQLQFQQLKKEIEICTSYIDLNNVNLYVNNTKTVYGQLTELNDTAKSLNFQENFLNYDSSDFKSNFPSNPNPPPPPLFLLFCFWFCKVYRRHATTSRTQ